MAERLMVKEPFADYVVGDRITDAKTMKRVVASHPDHVLRETVEDEAVRPAAPASAADAAPLSHAKLHG